MRDRSDRGLELGAWSMEMGGRGRHHLDGTARRFLFRLLCFPVICSKPAPATYRLPQGICSPIGGRVAGRNGEREIDRESEGRPSEFRRSARARKRLFKDRRSEAIGGNLLV